MVVYIDLRPGMLLPCESDSEPIFSKHQYYTISIRAIQQRPKHGVVQTIDRNRNVNSCTLG